MEVRLLGPVEVVVDATAGAIAGAGERALLALLALRCGTVVPADRLVDDLWGSRLPANPSNALQTRVSKLRRALSALGADGTVVSTVGGGYRLELPVEQVDVGHVESLLALARAAIDRGADEEGHRHLVAALGRWRGPALADVTDEPWAAAEARRLEELRLAALQDRVEVDLRAGRHGDVVTELESLVAVHPLRERFHAQRMLALYRCGRQAEALLAYQQARRVLDDELGLDPSAELRELEAAILRQDPDLAAPARVVASSQPHPVLPVRVASLVGREVDIAEVAELLEDSRLVTITGPGGAGKTTLALETASQRRDRFDDGVWFVDLSAATHPADVAASVARVLSLPPGEPMVGESRGQRLARQLESSHRLVVLDNCEHLVDACAELVDQLLSGTSGIRVLATSREALAVPGEVQFALAPLPVDAAVELFVARARAASREFKPDPGSLEVVAEICAALDGMPLAIELAAARVKTLPVQLIAARLADRFSLLTSGARTAQARHRTLRATVDWSYQLLSEPEQRVLQRLSVLSGSWELAAAEEVCAGDGVEISSVLDVVTRLVDRSLVVAESGRFRLLETVRQFAADELAETGCADAVMARNVERLLRLAESCEPQLRGGDEAAAIRRLAEEHDGLRAALAWCIDTECIALGQRLAGSLAWFWHLNDHEEGRRMVEPLLQARPTTAATAPDDPGSAGARGRALQALAIVARPSGVILHPDPTCATAAEESIALLEVAGDPRRAAFSKALLAVEGVAGHDVSTSHRLLDDAAAVLHDDAWSVAFVDYVRAKIAFRWGDRQEALDLWARAAQTFRRLRSAWGVMSVLAHQGYDLRIAGDYEASLAADEESLDMACAAGLLNTAQMMYGDSGITRVLLGDEAGARAHFDAASELCRCHGFRAGDGMAKSGYGLLALRDGDHVAARDHFEQAVATLMGVGHLTVLAAAQAGLGRALCALGDLDAAEAAHREVLDIAGRLNERWVLATGTEGLAGVALARGDATRAAEQLGAAATLRELARSPLDPIAQADVDRITEEAVRALGRSGFDDAFTRGRGTPARLPAP